MTLHTVRGVIAYRFVMEVEIDRVESRGVTLEDVLKSSGARDRAHFGRLALADHSEVLIDDDAVEIAIESVEIGGIAWIDDGVPATGVADGKGGVVWDGH